MRDRSHDTDTLPICRSPDRPCQARSSRHAAGCNDVFRVPRSRSPPDAQATMSPLLWQCWLTGPCSRRSLEEAKLAYRRNVHLAATLSPRPVDGWPDGLCKGERMRVALMVTCINDAMFPDTGKAVVRLLTRLGVEVDFPSSQTCCAQPMVNTGYLDEAVPVVRNFVETFAGYDAVVTASGSCAGCAPHQHSVVARRSSASALAAAVETTSPRVHELSEFLVDVLGVTDVGAYYPHTVTYHPTCHSLRMLGVGDKPRRLLEQVRGLTLVDLPEADQCCGFGGTFAVKNADTSVAMGTDKVRHVRETGAEVLVAGDNSCLTHVGGLLSRQRAGVRVMHLAEVLAAQEGGP